MTDNTERAQVGWGLWLRWVLATSVVPAVVLTASWGTARVIADEDLYLVFFAIGFLLSVPLVLASTAIAQWLVLRRHVSRAGWWALASTVVYVVAGALLFALGAAVAPAVGEVVKRANTSLVGLPTAVGAALLGFFGYGAITGVILVRRLRQPEDAGFRLDRRTRTWLLSAAVILIVLMAGCFVFETNEKNNATIRRNNIIAGLQVPACSEEFEAPLSGDPRVTTCHIRLSVCNNTFCRDADGELSEGGRPFILKAKSRFFPLGDLGAFDGECLLVTGEVGMFGSTLAIFPYDPSDIEICQ